MKKYTVKLTKEQLQQLGKLGIKPEPKFSYPLFKQWKNDGEIVKFTSMSKGVTVWDGDIRNKVGRTSSNFVHHTDNNKWKDVVYDSERDLWDGQPVECWDITDTHRRYIGFYDAKNKCSFNYAGKRTGLAYDNYKALLSNKYDEWIIEAYKTLEK